MPKDHSIIKSFVTPGTIWIYQTEFVSCNSEIEYHVLKMFVLPVMFALDEKLQKSATKFFGVEVSKPMLDYAKQKNNSHQGVSKIEFLKYEFAKGCLFKLRILLNLFDPQAKQFFIFTKANVYFLNSIQLLLQFFYSPYVLFTFLLQLL